MRICHFGDWFGDWNNLPPADLYICTGNILKSHSKELNPRIEIYSQGKEVQKNQDCRKYFGNKEALTIMVRGSRDFVALSKLFNGATFEAGHTPTSLHYSRLVISSFRGSTERIGKGFSDISSFDSFISKTRKVSEKTNILVTHSPPHGMMDKASITNSSIGSHVLRAFTDKKGIENAPLKVHCFGGAVSSYGVTIVNNIFYSNAAGGYILFEYNYGSAPAIIELCKKANESRYNDKKHGAKSHGEAAKGLA